MILRSLGVSLADIASFVQKLQLEHGYQTKSGTSEEVDALRMVALRLQTLPELADTRAVSLSSLPPASNSINTLMRIKSPRVESLFDSIHTAVGALHLPRFFV